MYGSSSKPSYSAGRKLVKDKHSRCESSADGLFDSGDEPQRLKAELNMSDLRRAWKARPFKSATKQAFSAG
jgi:hypothetical protein